MEKPESELLINHFSHPHPLALVSFKPSSTPNRITCSACTKQASGAIYSCDSCNYCLHKPCSKMPQRFKHEADNHTLSLLAAPPYPEGAFECNACGTKGTGFCYRCENCHLDLHTACAFLRSSVKSNAHDHALNLCFESPYGDKAFICDICGGSGSNHWLYRCNMCEFDAHLKCAKDSIKLQPQSSMKQDYSTSGIQRQNEPQIVKSRSVPPPPIRQQPQVVAHYTRPTYPIPVYTVGPAPSSHQLHHSYTAPILPIHEGYVQPARRNDVVKEIVEAAITGIIEGGAQQIGQALLEGALGN
ncbi:C1-like, Zinc finger, RING FYVE PHD-type [Olea europaea subsp. europaea]|uniref:C1-like, Zinc finger, RING FYVE PHD-type n=2 Tax=Olea europaea subsp. europaea TaxID=158383 RepID=A0A8S0SYI4_OLEEU|nr:C1-like, Zinc finger, RING FYVE PHD-type [Olea europaea subsp. europaea]